MIRLDLTREERRIIAQIAEPQSLSGMVWYAVYLGPMVVFAVMGMGRDDLGLVITAFFSLLIFQLWRIQAEWSANSRYHPLFKKIDEALENDESGIT